MSDDFMELMDLARKADPVALRRAIDALASGGSESAGDGNELMTTREVEEEFKLSRVSIWRAGVTPARRLRGGKSLYRRRDVENALLQVQEVAGE